jgi:hypothetical protein
MCTKNILAREREENIARQQSPTTREMFSALMELTKKSPIDLLKTIVADWFTLIRITRLHCSEYAQKTQSEVDKYDYSSSKCVVKAFTLNDWKFYNSKATSLTSILQRANCKNPRQSSRSLFESRRIGKTVNLSLWLPTMFIRTSAQSEPHTGFSFVPRDWANQTQNRWPCLSINLE